VPPNFSLNPDASPAAFALGVLPVNANYKPLAFAAAIFLVLAVLFLVSVAFLHAAHLSASMGAALAFLPYLAALASGALLGHAARVRVLAQPDAPDHDFFLPNLSAARRLPCTLGVAQRAHHGGYRDALP